MSIFDSKGVNEKNSHGVNESYGVNRSYGVNLSDGVNESYGVNRSYGVNESYGVNRSYGVNLSDGVNRSYGVINSHGVSNHIFCADKEETYYLFKTEVSKQRFNEVWSELHRKLDGWFPKFNNAFTLWKNENEKWEKVNASEIESTLDHWGQPYRAWKDMPKEVIEYLRSLPEFDNSVFERVTGIKLNNKKQELLEKAQELIDKAEELKKQAQEM